MNISFSRVSTVVLVDKILFYNPGHNIFLQFTVFQDTFDSPQVKREFVHITYFVYELPHELLND